MLHIYKRNKRKSTFWLKNKYKFIYIIFQNKYLSLSYFIIFIKNLYYKILIIRNINIIKIIKYINIISIIWIDNIIII